MPHQKYKDSLSDILNRISFSTDVFFIGNLCGIQSLGGTEKGHIHLLKSGTLTVLTNEGHKICMNKPSVIFIPGATEHRVITNETEGASLVCAHVSFESVNNEMLLSSLPQFLHFNIDEHENIGKVARWIFDEAFAQNYGKQATIDRLTDIFFIEIMRDVIAKGIELHGALSAASHPAISKVVQSLHASPEHPWTLETMAQLANMSRSKFAALFKDTLGLPPNEYITDLRVSLAQRLLKDKKPVNIVANSVGYEHGSALARVFKKKLGLTPKEWLLKYTQNR